MGIDIIKDDLSENKDHYLFITNALRLSKETLLKQEDDLFYEDIMEGYKEALKQLLTEDIVKRLNVGPEDVMIALESFDIVKYIEGE
jgi:hypothetical protein